jgi:hypothetical protein
MDHRLARIKRMVADGRYEFTLKADLESAADGLTRRDVIESVLNAQSLRAKRSTSTWRQGAKEDVYIIDSENFDGIAIYSKGVIRRLSQHEEDFYILISGKRPRLSG